MSTQRRLVHLEDYRSELREKCFEYFYWFGRFEFAMKENRLVKAGRYGEAQPDWRLLIDTFSKSYEITAEAARLLEAPPQRQICQERVCDWEPTNLDREETELGKVTLIVRTIRNNLFHGGKSGQTDWDNPERNLFLLANGKAVLDSLASLTDLEADYLRLY